MMLKEFAELTGFTPTYEEYEEIESQYMECDDTKQDFCAGFVADGKVKALIEARARRIEELESILSEDFRKHVREICDLQDRIEALQEQLDKELEWKPLLSAGTQMSQKNYEDLRHSSLSVELPDSEAATYICDKFGFDLDRIKIIRTVHTYEVNRHDRMREASKHNRAPVNGGTDWNYFRFDCAGISYEVINGELNLYEC